MLFVTWWTVHSLIAFRVGIQQNVVYLPLSSHFSKLCSQMATCLIGFDLKYYLPKSNLGINLYFQKRICFSFGWKFVWLQGIFERHNMFLSWGVYILHKGSRRNCLHENTTFYNQRSSMTKYMMACVYFAISNTITHHACEEFELYNCTATWFI